MIGIYKIIEVVEDINGKLKCKICAHYLDQVEMYHL